MILGSVQLKNYYISKTYFSFVLRNKTPPEYMYHGLNLYFLRLSLRRRLTSQQLSCFIKRNHVSIWNWIQKYKPWKYLRKRKIKEYIIDEIAIKAGSS